MKILIAGANGMVGRACARHGATLAHEIQAHTRHTLDIADSLNVRQVFERERPDAVINCAAWTDVDGCELDAARAFRQNAEAVENLAVACRMVGASLLTISTDYVFDGAKEDFYTQRDDPNPQSVYGRAKLDGERRAMHANARTMIVRSGWIFGASGGNFLSNVVPYARRAQEAGKRLQAITDSFGTPTYADDLVARLFELVERDLPGIYHVVNAGAGATFYEFARHALDLAELQDIGIDAVSMDDLNRPAPRPRNSRLRCLLSEAVGLAALPHWEDSLARFIKLSR